MTCSITTIKILLFKAESTSSDDSSDEYRKAFESTSLPSKVFFTPVLTYELVEAGVLKLIEAVSHHDSPIFVITSPRVAQAIQQALEQASAAEKEKILLCKVACIGYQTLTSVRKVGLVPLISDADSANALGERLIELKPKHILYLCGNNRRDTLPTMLKRAKIAFTEIVVYKSCMVKSIVVPEEFMKMDENSDKWCGFFSPLGIKAVLDNLVVSKFILSARNLKFIAIGKTTAKALNERPELSSRVIVASPEPRDLAMASTIQNFYRSET